MVPDSTCIECFAQRLIEHVWSIYNSNVQFVSLFLICRHVTLDTFNEYLVVFAQFALSPYLCMSTEHVL
jgi:hypothetical protein